MNFIESLPFNISFIDGLLGGFLLLAALHGWARGLLKETLTPVVWLGAGLLAFRFAYDAAPFLEQWIDNSVIRLIIAGVAIGVILVMIGGLMVSLLNNFFRRFGLGGTNRLLGLLFGLAWGSLVLIVLIGVLGEWFDEAQWWHNSKVIAALKPYEAVVSEEFWQWVEVYKQYLGMAESN